MSEEYIERGALLGKDGLFSQRGCVGKCGCCGLWSKDGCRVILEAPAADVVEVKHGRWVKYIPAFGVGDFIKCSVCDRSRVNNLTERTPYCPNCGAKMDGE